MYKYNFFISCLLCIVSFSVSGQQIQKRTSAVKSAKPDRDYLPNTVIVKLKPEVSKKASGTGLKNEFSTLNKKITLSETEKMFPSAKPLPKMKTNRMGQPYIDLSRTYIFKYSSELPIEEVMDELMKSGKVEYAEPFFIDQVLFVPNDPYADSTTGSQKYYLKAMQFYEALDIEKGDPNVVIGIIDTGTKQDHEDLIDNIKVNPGDPINGIDDDGDGYIDNYRGWDLGNNDNNTYNPSSDHGCSVAGTAGATPDNGIGMTGTGYNCKILPIKAATDVSGNAIIQGYNGIIYAADHGARVINLSWGGPGGYSITAQNVINYAAINHDIVVVAAAGNNGKDNYFYPASYDHVLSVAALDKKYLPALDTTVEVRVDFGTFNYGVDVCAQGTEVTGTNHSTEKYSFWELGSSFSSPLVAGAAGLVRSHYPTLNALQVAELLRVTCDPLIDTVAENIEFKNGKMGKGRINIYRALTDTKLPSIRMYADSAFSKYGNLLFGSDTVSVVCKFRNFLRPSADAHAILSVLSNNATIINGDFNIGALATLDSISNKTNPYKLYIHPSQITDDQILLRIDYVDAATGYSDFQIFSFSFNPSYIDININQVSLTVTSNSRLGYLDANTGEGNSFIYKGNQLLFEGGLMIGTSSDKVVDGVRGAAPGSADNDFTTTLIQHFTQLSEGDQAAVTKFQDKLNSDSIGLIIEQRSYAFANSPDDKYIIIEYDIQNVSGDSIDTLYVGLYNDWDIQNAALNKGDWDAADSIGYTYATQAGSLYAGISLLTNNPPSCFTLDHSNVGGINVNPNDGFPSSEKFKTLSSGLLRKAGGAGSGNDISQVVGATLFNIPNLGKRTVAFAYVAGDNLADLKANSRQAKNTFRFYNTSQLPVVTNFNFCKGDTVDVTITPSNGQQFAYYNSVSATTPISTGPSAELIDISKSDTIYVSGIDSLFESPRVPVKITLHADLKSSYGYFPKTVDLDVTPNGLVYFINTSQNFSDISWDMGDGQVIDDLTEFGHNYTMPGTYKIILTTKDNFNCTDTISHILKVVGTPTSVATEFDSEGLLLYPNPARELLIIHLQQTSPEPVTVEIYNSLSQKLNQFYSSAAVLERKFNIPVNGLEKGVHYAKIISGSRIITRKFIVE